MKVFAYFGIMVLVAIVSVFIDHCTGWTEAGTEFGKVFHHAVALTSGAVLFKVGNQFWRW
jgi:hypothetical protein